MMPDRRSDEQDDDILQVRTLEVEPQSMLQEPRQSRIAGCQDCSGHQDRRYVARDGMDVEIRQEDCHEY